MSRQACQRCERPLRTCYCHLLASVDNRWPVLILQHALERRHALNTGRIAGLCLQRCGIVQVHDGSGDEELHNLAAALSPRPVLIYPGRADLTLCELAQAPPTPLLFIDASWRKSRRLLLQSSWLQGLPRVALPAATPARYRIRKEPRTDYRSTLEAIVAVLDVVNPCGAAAMLEVMDWMIGQQIADMGTQVWQANYPGEGSG